MASSTTWIPSDSIARFEELRPQYEECGGSSRVLRPPNGIPAAMEVLLEELQANVFAPKALKSDWLASMVDRRDSFAGAGFYADSTHPYGDVVYNLFLPFPQPLRIVFLECHRKPLGISAMAAHGCYEYEPFRFVDHTLTPWKDSSDIWVLPDVRVSRSEVHTIS